MLFVFIDVYVEPSLSHLNEINLVRVTDLFNVLFNAVCKCAKSFLLKQIGKYSIVTKIGEW